MAGLRQRGRPFVGSQRIHGITHDGRHVWAATDHGLVAFDPATGEIDRTLDRASDAGTAFDGRYLYQIAEARIDKIDPATGEVVAPRSAPSAPVISSPAFISKPVHGRQRLA